MSNNTMAWFPSRLAGIACACFLFVPGISETAVSQNPMDELALDNLAVIDHAALDNMRGGFFGDDFQVSLGFENILMIDGVLEAQSAFYIPEISIDPQSGEPVVVDATMASLTTADGGLEASQLIENIALGKPSVYQNEADSKLIQRFQTLDIKIKGIEQNFIPNTNHIINSAILDSLY